MAPMAIPAAIRHPRRVSKQHHVGTPVDPRPLPSPLLPMATMNKPLPPRPQSTAVT